VQTQVELFLAATAELLAAWLRSNGRQLEVGEMDIKHSE
jgi:hypothetical protein